MEVTKSTRTFKYNGVVLQDPGPAYSLEQVREFYATLYPEIVNAAIEGPTISGTSTVYEFRRAVGTKGAVDIAARVERFIARRRARAQANYTEDYNRKLHEAVADAAAWRRRIDAHGACVQLPSDAIPLLP